MTEQSGEAAAGSDGVEAPQRRWRAWQTRERTVLITGISGSIGQAVARRLHRRAQVLGIDTRRFIGAPKDVEFFQLDIRRRRAEDVFRRNNIDALIHLSVTHDPRRPGRYHEANILGMQKVLELCQTHNIGKVVMLSSAYVYGPSPGNNQFLTEEAPLMGASHVGWGWIRDMIAVDMYCSSFFWRHPEIETVILRPVHIIGAALENMASNYLRQQTIPTLMGFDPMMQVVHSEDVISAMELALRPGIRGVYNIAGPGAVPLSRLISTMGKASLPVPEPVAKLVQRTLWRTRLSAQPVEQLDHIKYVCMVDDSRARAHLRYAPEYSLAETLAALDSKRSPG